MQFPGNNGRINYKFEKDDIIFEISSMKCV